MQSRGPPKVDGFNTYNQRYHYQPYVSPREQGRKYDNRMFENQRQEVNQLSLESLVKRSKEILATELQLQLPPPPSLIEAPKRGKLDRYFLKKKGGGLDECANNLPLDPVRRRVKRTADNRGGSGRLFGPEDICGSRRSYASDVRSLLPQPMLEPKNDDEIHGSTSVILIQHHHRTNMNERTSRHLIHHSCNDEISYPEGNSHIGSPRGYDLRMQATRKQTDFGCIRLATGGYGWSPKEDKSAFFERESKYQTGTIKVKEGRWNMEDVYRLQEPQLSIIERLLPLPEIDLKIEAVIGFPFKCFLDAYKGYHQIQMSGEDKEKTGQHEVKSEKVLIRGEGREFPLLYGYVGRDPSQPKKIKAVADMQSSNTLKEMQSLSRKLAALDRFLSRSAKRALPFFETLKNIIKENKDDFRWREEA
uniref:Reverse transcriptase domain-containing protein n=1 Tax=Tanacetum cinerariifolium TaxID=118510 RepID=A0A6L2NEE1_TANCI|nr:reverse transcriptase domain-containing protein [Tanacetum cinerariifolium]